MAFAGLPLGFFVNIRVYIGVYWDDGKDNGNYYSIIGIYIASGLVEGFAEIFQEFCKRLLMTHEPSTKTLGMPPSPHIPQIEPYILGTTACLH